MSRHDGESPVSFRVNVARLPRTGTPVWLDADEAQRDALARGHGLQSVERFRVDAVLTPWKRGGIKVEGTVSAAIVQSCVVTLEPVPATIEERFEALFVPEASRLARPGWADAGELVLDADGPDAPETFSGDHIDVGAVAEEFFELAIDPYPRAAGASLPGEDGATGAGGGGNPFRDQLAKLARKS